MKLKKARIRKYRSIRDTEEFEIEPGKTILVGPNEAGKTVILQALQQIRAPEDIKGFDALRDYPRALYNDITTGKVNPANVTVVEAHFTLDEEDRAAIPEPLRGCTYVFGRRLDNSHWHRLDGVVKVPTYGSVKRDLLRLAKHIDARATTTEGTEADAPKPSATLAAIVEKWTDDTSLRENTVQPLANWLDEAIALVDEANETEESRLEKLNTAVGISKLQNQAAAALKERIPVFVLFSNYFRVRPIIHLAHLAQRLETGILDDDAYDYGNNCLMKLLGFTAAELSKLGRAVEPDPNDSNAMQAYRDQLDTRGYQLNAAEVRLTREIRDVWQPDPNKAEADRLRIVADGQYLKVVVEDELGVNIELDQRSEGFQWLVSFFVVFFAETADQHKNAILLLDEPGLSLHGLKQREFRQTVSRLAAINQTIYTTHSPFLVGPDELDLVRVVEMTDRNIGTKVHTKVVADDPAALLPLQEAFGYDLAQSLFAQQRNLILEGLTDYWYVEAVSALLRDANIANLHQKIALVPASSAGKVVYFATILHAHKLQVAALLDSDAAGDQAADQEVLVHALGNKRILRTKDYLKAAIAKPEIEDLLRETLVAVAMQELSWDIGSEAKAQSSRPILDIFAARVPNFSKYKLAKAFLRWTRDHAASDLTAGEQEQWSTLISSVNAVLK